LLIPVAFEPAAKQYFMVRRVWWRKIAYLLVTRKQKERRGRGQHSNISFKVLSSMI
jgi:hypothetical protein